MLTVAALAGIGSIKSDGFEISNEEVRCFGDTAIVIEKLEIDGEMPPVGRLPPIKFMAVFQRTDGQWIMFSRAMTPCLKVAVEQGVCWKPMTAMRLMKHYRAIPTRWVLVTLIAALGTPVWAQAERSLISDPSVIVEDPVNRALGQQHYHDMWLFLSESKITWIRTAAAVHFIDGRFVEIDPDLGAEGERLLTAVIATEPRDTLTLWLLLDACHTSPEIPGCASTQIGDRLIESAPDNAAVYLKAADITVGSFAMFDVLDNKANRQALLHASRAPLIDIYYGRDALELYHELKAFEEGYRSTHEPAIDQPSHVRAFSLAWTVSTMLPLMTFGGLYDLCEAQVLEGRTKYADACMTLAGTMQRTGKTLITRALGYGLERKVMEAMGDDKATVLYLARKARMSTQVSVCQMPAWMKTPESMSELDESTVIAYLSDLSTVGEVGAIRNRAIREYEANPDDYEQDPALCDLLMDLDSESMGIFLGKLDPKRMMESE